MVTVYTGLLALFLSAALLPVLIRLAPVLGLVDIPDQRKIHIGTIPRIGGIAIIIGVLVPVLLWVPDRADLDAYLLAAGVLAVFGLLDDMLDLHYTVKFVGQIVAALILVFGGDVAITHFPFIANEELPFALAAPFTVLVLVGVTNAVNLSDGLDGLAGGISLLSLAFLGLFAYLSADISLVMLCMALFGSIAGFLRFNSHPARVFMGDLGSQFLGFSVAAVAIILTQVSNPALSPVLPILVLGLPLLDTVWVMTRRIVEGVSPFKPDRRHIHHRLLDLGYSHFSTVMIIYSVQVLMMTLAYFLPYHSDILIMGLFGLFCLLIVVVLELAKKHRHVTLGHVAMQEEGLKRFLFVFKGRGLFTRWPLLFLGTLVPVIFLIGGVFGGSVSEEIGWMSVILLLLYLSVLNIKLLPFYLIERLVVFVAAACVVFLLDLPDNKLALFFEYEAVLFIVIAVLVAAFIGSADRSSGFRVSPMDFLVVLTVIVLPSLSVFFGNNLGVIAIKMLVLFYACEILIASEGRHWDFLRVGVIITLLILTVRAFAQFG